MRLANRVAIITGGGSGIGRASAELFAREGAKIVLAQRTKSTAEETIATIKSGGGEAIFVRTDVTIASEVEHLIRETINRFGKIDILFNNAGETQSLIPTENIDESLWDQMFAVNVKSIFLAAKYAVPEMKKTGGGVIINTTAMLGVRPKMCRSAYSSAKAAAIMLTKSLALELASHNIRVNSISLIATDTPLLRRSVAKDMPWEEYLKTRVSNVPLGRLDTPEDVANAALYLASDESSMLTGTRISVDGGCEI